MGLGPGLTVGGLRLGRQCGRSLLRLGQCLLVDGHLAGELLGSALATAPSVASKSAAAAAAFARWFS